MRPVAFSEDLSVRYLSWKAIKSAAMWILFQCLAQGLLVPTFWLIENLWPEPVALAHNLIQTVKQNPLDVAGIQKLATDHPDLYGQLFLIMVGNLLILILAIVAAHLCWRRWKR